MSTQPPTLTAQDAFNYTLKSEPTPKPTSLTGQLEQIDYVWVSEDGKYEIGIWEAGAGTFTGFRDGYHETATIVKGTATITAEDGTVIEAKPGTILVTPEGWKGTWVCHEPVRKIFNIMNL